AMTVRIGIIANPVSARDIRRVISHAAGLTLGERANMLLRILQALAACKVDEVLLMPEMEGLRLHLERQLPAAAEESRYPLPRLRWLDMPVRTKTEDSVRAAEIMRREGVAALLVLGGDGTHRAVVKGCRDIPIAGISTGTNNAFPPMREVTVTAWAAGLYAAGRVPDEHALRPNKCLHIRTFGSDGLEKQNDVALIDAAVLNEAILGAKAISQTDTLRTVISTQASIEAVGLSAVAAALQPVGRHDAGGLLIELAPTYGTHEPAAKTFTIQAVLSPGKVEDIEIASFRRFKAGEEYRVSGQNCLIALDGEREIALRDNEYALISLQENAFYTLDVPAVLKYVCAQKLHEV
ncbi:NAD(+)/NADH kinase, partial [Neisseria dentiae]|uniref:NAD(+)/NADH kinase n=5 Tax=Neisseria dentiae TaxID=194197 RepID=UPI0035A1B0A8